MNLLCDKSALVETVFAIRQPKTMDRKHGYKNYFRSRLDVKFFLVGPSVFLREKSYFEASDAKGKVND